MRSNKINALQSPYAPKMGVLTQSGAAPDCLQRPLVPRVRFRQQVSASVRLQFY